MRHLGICAVSTLLCAAPATSLWVRPMSARLLPLQQAQGALRQNNRYPASFHPRRAPACRSWARARPHLVLMKAEQKSGVGAGRDLPSPSGINQLPLPLQAATVLAISMSIGLFATALAGP